MYMNLNSGNGSWPKSSTLPGVQVTIWAERPTGQAACTSTHRCPSDQEKAVSGIFLEHTSSSMPATCAT